ncbi:MAG: amidase [Vicinamibacteraceae bacterium]
MIRRHAALLLLATSLLSAAACTSPAPGPSSASTPRAARVDVVELSATEARRLMADGTLTSRALTQAYLDRIAAIDDGGPTLGAVIALNPKALADADARDAERKAGTARGPLHGLPILIKDNVDVAGLVNSAGSLALANHRPAKDAFLVTRLREAGAVILGKTNLSEWANFRSSRSSSGWSSRGGQTKNPYALDRNPCGSSSGTGAAIAASLGAIGIGTETDGSIICPASVNGLVGLKPTVGLVSRRGIIPISVSQDTAGPMGRTVADVALLLTAVASADAADPAGPGATGKVAADYTAFLRPDALKGKRFGVLRQAMGYHPDVDAAMEKSIAVLKANGAVVEDVTMPTYDKWGDPEFEVLLYEFKDGLDAYLKASGASPDSLASLIAWNTAHASTAMPFFGQEIFEKAARKGPLTDAAYLKARDTARRLAGRDGLLAAITKHKLDAVIAPSTAPAWLTDHVLGDHFAGAGYGVAAVAGTPSLTVPMGESHGLPIGLTLMGPAFSEGELIALGYAFEQLTKARKPPAFTPSAS